MGKTKRRERRIGLRLKFAVLLGAVLAVSMAVGGVVQVRLQQDQAEREMLQTVKVLATEMDAVWDFMERNQNQFVQNENGTYNLYCVVAAKSISRAFTESADGFAIRYTNTTTRRASDAPDLFEQEALAAFRDDDSIGYYYQLTEVEGEPVFRYAEPLYYAESCLECHGGPAGELDALGYAKEGRSVGDLAGIASILMPAATYEESIVDSTLVQTGMLVFALICGLLVMFYAITKLVLRPAKHLEAMAESVERHDFNVSSDGIGDRDEISELADHFMQMSRELKGLCEGLEAQVGERTRELQQAHDVLVEQRRELEFLNVRLAEDNRYKSDFLNIVSHEIRTPLTSILAFAEIWERNGNAHAPEDQAIVDEIRLSSQILLGMVNNILEMARAEAGRLIVNSEPVDLAELLAEVRGATLFQARRQHVRLVCRSTGSSPVVVADGEKLRHILVNLTTNALKFSEPGSAVTASATVADDGRDQSPWLELVVSDTGRGIAEADLPFVFDRFAQGRDSSRHQHGGSGLGLALVRELVELMKGTVEVVSQEGAGSVFAVRIPVAIPKVEEW